MQAVRLSAKCGIKVKNFKLTPIYAPTNAHNKVTTMSKIFDYKGLCLVEIGGSACAGCHQLMPAARQAAENAGIPFYYFDAEEAQNLIKEWNVTTVPSLFLADGGAPFAEAHGYQPQEILDIWIEFKLQEHKDGK